VDRQEARREGKAEGRKRIASQGHRRGTEGQGKALGANTEGTLGDEETGHVEHAGFDPGMEAEGPRKRLEEVAQWKGEEIEYPAQMYDIMDTVLIFHVTRFKHGSIGVSKSSDVWVSY